jgi:hypothetical protein
VSPDEKDTVSQNDGNGRPDAWTERLDRDAVNIRMSRTAESSPWCLTGVCNTLDISNSRHMAAEAGR